MPNKETTNRTPRKGLKMEPLTKFKYPYQLAQNDIIRVGAELLLVTGVQMKGMLCKIFCANHTPVLGTRNQTIEVLQFN